MDPRGAPRSRDLLEAVQRGRQEELEERLRQGETPNTTFTLGRSPLHCAAANANLAATVALLEHGADVALLDSNGYSALHMACTRRATDTPAIVDRLIAAGAEVNLANRFQRSPLHECVIVENREAAERLLAGGADTELKEKDGKTARELAFARDSYEMAELVGGHPVGAAALAPVPRGDPEGAKGLTMTVAEEKEALKRRLAELEAAERSEVEDRLRGKRSELEGVREDYRSRREVALAEMERLERHVAALQEEEAGKAAALEAEIGQLAGELKAAAHRPEGQPGQDLEELLMCPVCLDVAKPPLQVWQCPEGHIICGSCAARPELLVCPQCRVSLAGILSRNRALEDLSRRTFPREAETAARARGRARGRGGEGPGAARGPRPGARARGRRAPTGSAMAQVDQNIDFRYLRHLGAAATAMVEQPIDELLGSGPAFTDARSSDEDGGYDLTSEVFLENVDDEFMPNFPTPDSVPGAVGGQVPVTVSAGRSAALVQRMNQFRLGTSPRHTHRRTRRSSPPSGNRARARAGQLEAEDEERDEWEDSGADMDTRFDSVMNMIPTHVGQGAVRAPRTAEPSAGRGARGQGPTYRARYSRHGSGDTRQARTMR